MLEEQIQTFDNPLKQYRLEPTENIRSKAERCRAEQLAAQWPAELAMAEILRSLGLAFEHQAIVYRPGSYICVDFLVRDQHVAFELDGSAHDLQRGYDLGRDAWLERAHGVRTVRIANAKALHDRPYVEGLVRRALGLSR